MVDSPGSPAIDSTINGPGTKTSWDDLDFLARFRLLSFDFFSLFRGDSIIVSMGVSGCMAIVESVVIAVRFEREFGLVVVRQVVVVVFDTGEVGRRVLEYLRLWRFMVS